MLAQLPYIYIYYINILICFISIVKLKNLSTDQLCPATALSDALVGARYNRWRLSKHSDHRGISTEEVLHSWIH